MSEHSQKSKRSTLWYAFLILLMVAGAVAVFIRAKEGLIVTNLTSTAPWGTWVAFYIYFVGMSAGAFLLSTLIYVFGMEQYEKIGKDALLVAILSMVLAMAFILVDLGHMERFWHTLWYMNWTSVLAYEVRFYVLYIVLLFSELYFAMRIHLIKASSLNDWKGKIAKFLSFGSKDTSERSIQHDHKVLKILGTIGLPVAIFGVHGGTGALFAVAKARPFLNSALFPVIFVVSALVSGTALLIAFYVIRNKVSGNPVDQKMVKSLAGLLALFLFIDVGLEFYEFLIGAYGLEHEELATITTMIKSDFSWSFWVVQMFIGVVVPLFLIFARKTKESVNAIAAAAIMVVIGILGVRFNIVLPALIVPVMTGLPEGYYYPTWIEILSSSGIIAMGLFLYTLAVTVLPIHTESSQVSSNHLTFDHRTTGRSEETI
ncbi:NrfD/PsrC family molybdoenzyme membrane anchor subunit [Desulfosporosinus sp. BICA1-9]|uniref:NrfD/PsrC family molybdoenzyme membrane anchor subunit n=1 Tax=Desulfosporosinus sp. BICA1-9 TaxID=1531958 RepID=UPI00054C3F4A|nr:NrfD/PsrC family molybdoenzyme membrane anchor subunit [Desulfosporosinus sp. BICA1-9]KJS47324.1 MAG: molybdopterin oxidoreductase [Peptococcaceae bacterium BRH_c23]KJS81917.1 MAG: molybdopterin oxidoreductase [Desulfosporosinus sp. BICA1-9]HBW39144.1 molybdopterin oxidoreductase [Desulfosporosinus sp.]